MPSVSANRARDNSLSSTIKPAPCRAMPATVSAAREGTYGPLCRRSTGVTRAQTSRARRIDGDSGERLAARLPGAGATGLDQRDRAAHEHQCERSRFRTKAAGRPVDGVAEQRRVVGVAQFRGGGGEHGAETNHPAQDGR